MKAMTAMKARKGLKVMKAMTVVKANKVNAAKAMKALKGQGVLTAVAAHPTGVAAGPQLRQAWQQANKAWHLAYNCAEQAMVYGSMIYRTRSATECQELYWCVEEELRTIRGLAERGTHPLRLWPFGPSAAHAHWVDRSLKNRSGGSRGLAAV